MLSKPWEAYCAVRSTVVLVGLITAAAVVSAQPSDEDPFGSFEGELGGAPSPGRRGDQRVVANRAQPFESARLRNEARIEAALDQPLRDPLDFADIPLLNLMEVVSEEYEIPIIFDLAALDDLAISPETEVSVNLRNISLRSALDLLLSSTSETAELTYLVDDEVLLITTTDEAQARLEVRVYRIDDLIRDEHTGALDFDRVVDLLATTVEHDSWQKNETGEGSMIPLRPGILVVSQTRRVHQQIGELLAEIRAVKQQIESETTVHSGASGPITAAIRIQTMGGDHAERSLAVVRDAVLHSVAWTNNEGADSDDSYLAVLPDRVIVRHTPQVVAEVTRVIDALQMRPSSADTAQEKSGGGFF